MEQDELTAGPGGPPAEEPRPAAASPAEAALCAEAGAAEPASEPNTACEAQIAQPSSPEPGSKEQQQDTDAGPSAAAPEPEQGAGPALTGDQEPDVAQQVGCVRPRRRETRQRHRALAGC